MKIFVGEIGGKENSPLQLAIRQVGGLANEIVDSPEKAELIITDNHGCALSMLKEHEEAQIAIFIPLCDESTLNGAQALKKRFPGRITVCRLLDSEIEPGDEMIVPYLLKMGGKRKPC